MKCDRCGFDNPPGFRFCGRCGRKMISDAKHKRVVALCKEANRQLAKHVSDMRAQTTAEKSKLSRAFEDKTGMSARDATDRMSKLEKHLKSGEFDRAASLKAPVKDLANYYDHLCARIRETETDPEKRKEALRFAGKCGSTAVELAGLVATLLA